MKTRIIAAIIAGLIATAFIGPASSAQASNDYVAIRGTISLWKNARWCLTVEPDNTIWAKKCTGGQNQIFTARQVNGVLFIVLSAAPGFYIVGAPTESGGVIMENAIGQANLAHGLAIRGKDSRKSVIVNGSGSRLSWRVSDEPGPLTWSPSNAFGLAQAVTFNAGWKER